MVPVPIAFGIDGCCLLTVSQSTYLADLTGRRRFLDRRVRRDRHQETVDARERRAAANRVLYSRAISANVSLSVESIANTSSEVRGMGPSFGVCARIIALDLEAETSALDESEYRLPGHGLLNDPRNRPPKREAPRVPSSNALGPARLRAVRLRPVVGSEVLCLPCR